MEAHRIELFRSLLQSDQNLIQIRELLVEGIDPNEAYELRNTPLHAAAESSQDNIGVVATLIIAGANVNRRNSMSYTPLHFAVIRQKRDMVEALLQAGADINKSTSTGHVALHYAINYNSVEFLNLDGFITQFIFEGPDMHIIEILLRHENINVNATNVLGETPLMWAVNFRHPHIVKALLEKADPNICNSSRESPLHTALNVSNPCFQIVYPLLSRRADLCIKNERDQTPIDILIDRTEDDQYCMFAKMLVKMASFYNYFNEEAISNLERHPGLATLQRACRAESISMETQNISPNLTVREFLHRSFNGDQFKDEYNNLFLDLYEPLVNLLITERYSAYLHDILISIDKFQLYKVLRNNLENEARNSRNIHIIKLHEMINNCDLSLYMSHWVIFQIILSISNLNDNEINNILRFGI